MIKFNEKSSPGSPVKYDDIENYQTFVWEREPGLFNFYVKLPPGELTNKTYLLRLGAIGTETVGMNSIDLVTLSPDPYFFVREKFYLVDLKVDWCLA